MAHMYAFLKCFWLSSHCYDFSDVLFTIIVWAGYYHYYASHSQTITNEILYLICCVHVYVYKHFLVAVELTLYFE